MRNEPIPEKSRLTNMKYQTFFFLSLFSFCSWAQSISWEEALRYTIEGSPELRSAENEYRAKKEEEAATIGNFLPKISATTSLTESKEIKNTTYSAGLNFSQNLFNGLSDSARYDGAKLRSEVSRWNLIALKAKTTDRVDKVVRDMLNLKVSCFVIENEHGEDIGILTTEDFLITLLDVLDQKVSIFTRLKSIFFPAKS